MDIKRQTELYIVEALQAALPEMTFVPFSGGDRAGSDSFNIEPPFGVVAVTECKKTHQQEATYLATGSVQWISHMTEATPQEHSVAAHEVKSALVEIATQANSTFSFHGIDVDAIERSESQDARARAEIIRFVAGVGG